VIDVLAARRSVREEEVGLVVNRTVDPGYSRCIHYKLDTELAVRPTDMQDLVRDLVGAECDIVIVMQW
jgi:hypothetical protein